MPRQFSALPAELVDLIAANASSPDLLALCRTNRRVYAGCLRQIYCDSSPRSARAVVLFLRAIISNKLAASYVLTLTMQTYLAPVFKAFGALVRTGMSNLTSLQELKSIVPQIFHAFSAVHFDRLHECMIPLSHDTAPFLRLHPKLVHVVLYDSPGDPPIPMSLWTPPIPFPYLKSFMGPHTVAPLLLQNSPAALAATLTYDNHDANAYAETLLPISRAVPLLSILFTIVPTWDPALPAAIAAHLPLLSTVKIRCGCRRRDDADTLPPFLLSIDPMIHALPDLTHLTIVATTPRPLDRRRAEFAHVRRWGDVLPALTHVQLPTRTTWVRDPGGVWFPKGADAVQWFVREVACGEGLPPKYLAELRGLCGEETVAELQAHYRALEAAEESE
ncbi:hypothetical protein C8R46DRAFT_1361238 [Mycena filopes]|nr:hypothetical protein C8R46DRAFT_1361238 [Mycena filopes]